MIKNIGICLAIAAIVGCVVVAVVAFWAVGVAATVAVYGAVAWVICEVLQSFGVI